MQSAVGADTKTSIAKANNMDASPVPPETLAWAEYWYPFAWKGLIWAGIITAVGACATIAFLLLQWKTSAVKESQGEWRTATLELQTAKARAELGKAQIDIKNADVKIAEAEARTKEAELKLEQIRERMRPRSIKGENFLKILEGKPTAHVEILFVRDDPECFQLSMQIRDFLKQAKWDVSEIRAIESADMMPRLKQYTSSMAVGGEPHGVTIVLKAKSQADFDREMPQNPFAPNSPLDTPFKALSAALGDSLGTISGGISYESGLPDGLLVVVGPKYDLN